MEISIPNSKYIKVEKEIKVFEFISLTFFFSLYVLPQYFGIPLPFFDFTAIRIAIIIMLLFMIGDFYKQQKFIELIKSSFYGKLLFPYIFVLVYTTILRKDEKAILNPLIEILSLYLLIYVIRYYIGVQRILKYIVIFSYIIGSLGLIEYTLQKSVFSYLETISGLNTGIFIRSGHYRIMGPCIHSLGYGLLLVTMIPIVCYDNTAQEINILKRKLLFILLSANIFLTGSRSTLSVFLLEIGLLILFSSKKNIKNLILVGSMVSIIFASFLMIGHNTEVGRYILLQITSVVDELFGSHFSYQFGAETSALSSSSDYREQLIYIFNVEWLNPFLGIGRSRSFVDEINGTYIQSVDNFYIAEYIRYAYPGLITYLLFLGYFLIQMLRIGIGRNSDLCKALFVGSVCYCINLIWVDSLQTLKYLYVLFAIFCSVPEYLALSSTANKDVKLTKSKYYVHGI